VEREGSSRRWQVGTFLMMMMMMKMMMKTLSSRSCCRFGRIGQVEGEGCKTVSLGGNGSSLEQQQWGRSWVVGRQQQKTQLVVFMVLMVLKGRSWCQQE
jgi:hypothetical protein